MVLFFAGVLSGDGTVTMAGALTLAIGIAIQNFPEGAIISLPLRVKETREQILALWACCREQWNRWAQYWPLHWQAL